MEPIRYPFEERTLVLWVPDAEDGTPGVAELAAPTVDELTDADVVDLTCFLTADGLNPGGTTNNVDGPGLCNKVDSQSVGSVGYAFTLKGYRDLRPGGDTFWQLAEWGSLGTLIVRRGPLFDVAVAADQEVEAYQVGMHQPVMGASARNTNQAFEVGFAVNDAEIKAVVAGGS